MIAALRFAALIFAFGLAGATARAHEVRPAYLEVRQTGMQDYAVTWKQPILGERVLRLEPVFPDGCMRGAEAAQNIGSALVRRFSMTCPLDGRTVGIDGLDRTMTDVYFRLEREDGDIFSAVLRPGAPSVTITRHASPSVAAYLRIGIDHILFGWDHLLFVAGLVLLVRPRQLLLTASAFTLAHSITLCLSAIAGVRLPGLPVEIVIALSIALIGLESLRRLRGDEGFSAQYPWAIAFGFGLIHGFGFAGALAEIGLPKGTELVALLLFNVGVELGQIGVIGALLLTGWLVTVFQSKKLSLLKTAGAYVVGTAGTYWAIERAAQMFSGL